MADEVDTHRGEEVVHKAVQCTIPRHFPALHHTTPSMLQLLQCFMLPSHTPLPSLPIAAPLLAIFPNWLKVPLNTSSKQNTQECWRLLTPNFGTLHFRDTDRYLEKYFSVEEFLDSGLCWVNCAVLKCCCIFKHFSLHLKSLQY